LKISTLFKNLENPKKFLTLEGVSVRHTLRTKFSSQIPLPPNLRFKIFFPNNIFSTPTPLFFFPKKIACEHPHIKSIFSSLEAKLTQSTWPTGATERQSVSSTLRNAMKKLISEELWVFWVFRVFCWGASPKGYFHFMPGERVQTIFSEIFE